VYIQYSGPNAPRAPGPIARVLAAVVAAIVLVAGIFLGLVFFVSALIALAVVGTIVSWRVRKNRPRDEPRRGGRTIEGEWREVSGREGWNEERADRRSEP
jgi:hypothetical protein